MPPAMDVIDLVDATDDGAIGSRKRSRDSSSEPRRTQRKTESRVFFGDVMAQEREMERLHYERSRQQLPASALPLRKSEPMAETSALRFAQKRAEKRRSARHNLRRKQTSCSSEENRTLLQELGPVQGDGATDFDVVLHSTAWRKVKVKEAPSNLLPDREELLQPFAIEMGAIPLDEFDDQVKRTCRVSWDVFKPKLLTLTSGTWGEARDMFQMDDRVRAVIDEATLLVKKCQVAREKALIANARQQIAAYLEDRPVVRAKMLSSIVGLPLKISRLEEVAARRLLRNAEVMLDSENRPYYSVGRNESGCPAQVYPRTETYFRKITPIPRSTTCMLVWGTHRVEDDPIIRFVPHFSTRSNVKSEEPQVGSMDRCVDTLVGIDDEVKEFVLRYAVSVCGSDQSVFDALQRIGAFAQPFANYCDILDRETRVQLWKRHLQELEAQQDSKDISAYKKRVIASILDECRALQAGTHLRDRLKPLPAHVILNYLQHGEELGVRSAPSKQYRELAIKYQDFFCRRCCVYSCRNHGCGQPFPIVRVDPRYPVVKATLKLWQRVEEEQLQSIEDTGLETDGVENSIAEEPVPELVATTDSPVAPKLQQTCDATNTVAGDIARKSLRAQTAACTTASLQLNTVHVHTKKMVRSKTTDVSEYVGLDGVYQAITQDQRLAIFSTDFCCGSHCSKPTLKAIQREKRHGYSHTTRDKPWSGSEITLLKKLVQCVGVNPCALTALLATRSCTDIADFFHQRERFAQDDLDELVVVRSGVCGRNREKGNGALGNSHEHLCRTRSQRMKDRGANHEFVPCNHGGGSCDSAQCSCMCRDHYCEKSCGCSPDCSNRFPGCHCEVGQCQTSKCPCYFAARECDPDVCISCGASELPVVMATEKSKGKSVAQLKICGNVNILRGDMRKIGVSASTTHGWGAYALENVKKGEFMYEYTGSLLSQDEAERRGNVYDKTTISFLFDLTEDSVVDATRKGNKSKFANHNSADPKCFARIMHVNGDHRIGIYAKEDVAAGDELFFDYGYSGVVPDWSQKRIGSSKDATSIEEDDGSKVNSVDEKEEHNM